MSATMKLLMIAAVAALVPLASVHGATTLPHYAHDKTLGVGTCASSLCHGAVETWKDSKIGRAHV